MTDLRAFMQMQQIMSSGTFSILVLSIIFVFDVIAELAVSSGFDLTFEARADSTAFCSMAWADLSVSAASCYTRFIITTSLHSSPSMISPSDTSPNSISSLRSSSLAYLVYAGLLPPVALFKVDESLRAALDP